jgi:IclR family pca regulon transcriptional regulator
VGDRYHVEGLARGLKILSLFSESRRELTLTQIAELAGLPLSTCFRILHTLKETDYIERNAAGRFAPGLEVLSLGFAALQSSDLVQAASTPLRKLAAEIGETINLGVLSGAQVLFVQRLPAAELLTANIQVGSLMPAVITSMGKLLLAFRPEADLRRRLSEVDFSRPNGPNAIHSLDALMRQLETIHRVKWAAQDEEIAFGLRSIAVPVYDGRGEVVAALNVAVPSSRSTVDDLATRFLDRMRQASSQISQRLGIPVGLDGAGQRAERSGESSEGPKPSIRPGKPSRP